MLEWDLNAITNVSIREAEKVRAQKRGDMKAEAETGVLQCSAGLGASRSDRRKIQVLPWSLRRECGPADALILAQ